VLALNSLLFKEFTVGSMVKQSLHSISITWFLTVFAVCIGGLLLSGCTEATNQPVDTYLVRIGSTTLTVTEFDEVFEISKIAYAHSDLMDPQVVAGIKQRLLNQMIEEMILLERAAATGITISDGEFEIEVQKIRADYPEGVFEEMLLEAAVSLEAWKKRLRKQLIARRFIQVELESRIAISSEEVARYYAKHFPDDTESKPGDKGQIVTDKIILQMLKNQKVQAAYAEWMKKNRRAVTVDINSQQWEKITQTNS